MLLSSSERVGRLTDSQSADQVVCSAQNAAVTVQPGYPVIAMLATALEP
jgi:hypothetical protein